MDTPGGTQSGERIVPAGEFKTNCLRLMDEVQETGAEIVVTKHRRPVVRISPFRQEEPRLVGSCKGQLRILSDIDAEPAIPLEDWEVISHPERFLNPEEHV
ncbi:type II toxin-antitoxin system Phd/YefM family antitoxin [Candidatus Poriferisocius sp.]|uniref:type II toxin-antitoxin system Phd/YefM family antitoxin n=1 Tax=Candidatus Poriferisocius sp. TaxID=3101276 RepID=UPI003B5A8A3C